MFYCNFQYNLALFLLGLGAGSGLLSCSVWVLLWLPWFALLLGLGSAGAWCCSGLLSCSILQFWALVMLWFALLLDLGDAGATVVGSPARFGCCWSLVCFSAQFWALVLLRFALLLGSGPWCCSGLLSCLVQVLLGLPWFALLLCSGAWCFSNLLSCSVLLVFLTSLAANFALKIYIFHLGSFFSSFILWKKTLCFN